MMTRSGTASCFILIFFSLAGWGQTCLQKLDSAEAFRYSYPEKAKFYANALLANLDSGLCVEEIGLAALYNNIGLILWDLHDRKRGLDAFHSGLAHELTLKDSTHRDLLGLYYNLSSLYQEVGAFQDARKYLDLAEGVVEANYKDDIEARVNFLHSKGVYYREVGNFDESLRALNLAIEKNGNTNDSLKVALQVELGTTYQHFGDLERSEEVLLEAVRLAEKTSELLYLQAIDRLSSLKIEQGEYSDSESFLLNNLEAKNEKFPNEPILILETLNELGFLYYRLNDLSAAQEYINEALETGRNIKLIRPYMLNNLGTIYMKQGNIEKAETYFRESSELFVELFGTMNPDYASSQNNLAGVMKARGELGEALNLYMRVLDMDRVIYGEDHPRYATSLNNVALLYLQLGNFSLAGKLLRRCKEIREVTLGTFHPLYIKSLNDLGIYYMVMNDTLAAMDQFNMALTSEINHMQDVFPVLTDKQRKLYFDQTRYNIERFCSLAFREQYLSRSFAKDALNHFINTKGILFYASEKMRKLIQGSGNEKIIATFNTWRDLKYRLAQSYLLTEEERRKQGISIEALEEECARLEKELAQTFRIFSDQDKSTYHTWSEISGVLPDSTAVVDIIQYRNYRIEVADETISQGFEDKANYMAFVIKSGGVLEPVKWSEDTDFDRAYAQYKNALKYGIRDVWSHKTFWEPVDRHLSDVNKVYFSPDGIYHKLNPAVFFDNSRESYVSDAYYVVNITSGKDLLYESNRRLKKEARIFGNPDFSRLSSDYLLQQLPGAEREAGDITNILDVRRWKTETFYFRAATEEQIKELSNPGVVHIATHGYFREDPDNVDPLYSSGLYLSRNENSVNDGLLSAYEAMNLILDQTSLVVLAACETGLGTIKNGEGVFGLQRAFLVAGSENVLLSLVKINDKAARAFMNLYYQEFLKTEDAQQAFFNAREAFKKVDPDPYNWGAYILVSKSL